MKAKIKNFQSIEDGEIDIEGFTVLVGKSNIGKSAVIRAIQGALTNLEGDNFVTLGTDHTEVELTTPGINLIWKKGGGHNDYVINGEELISVGRGCPPHIEEAGFGEMKVGRDSINVQIADQFNPLFLLQETGSLAAEAISDIGRLTDVQEALRNCEKDRREVRSTAKVRTKDLDKVRGQLNQYGSYEEDMASVHALKSDYEEITLLTREVETLERLAARISVLAGKIKSLKGVQDIEIPGTDLDTGSKEVETLTRYAAQFEKAKKAMETYEGVDIVDVPTWEDDNLTEALKALVTMESRWSRIQVVIDNY